MREISVNRPPSCAEDIPFALPDIGEGEIAAVVECLRSGWLTTGSRSAIFERDFANFLGGGVHAVAVSSATAGLEIALAAHGVSAGDEVITSDYTFTSTAMSVVHLGATPVLVDIDPATFNIDPDRVEAAISPRTKAIIPVHFAGLSCDMTAIDAIARRHGLKVIEDAAHALPTRWNNKLIGQGTSDATVFSFYATKTITTGEGGMITFVDPAAAKRARILRLHGIDRDIFSRDHGPGNGTKTPWRYDVVAPGFKSNMSDIVAAIGVVQLQRMWELHRRRAQLWATYDEGLAGLPVLRPPQARAGDLHSMHLYGIRLRDEAALSRDDFIAEMAKLGVSCSVHFIPLHCQTYWREKLGVSEAMFPQAQKAFEREVTLPLFTRLTDERQQFIIDAMRRLLS
jgi:dTDP-4-amino-4,6-dideoxygalactose transaminase